MATLPPDLLDSMANEEPTPSPQASSEEANEGVKDGQVPLEHQKAFKDILDKLRVSERDVRFRQVKSLKRNELFWIGQFNLFWNDSAGDWQSIQEGIKTLVNDELNIDPSLYDKAKVNIYRAYGESVIGAVSNGVPHLHYFPRNPDDPDDIRTAETDSLIGDKIETENDSETLMRRAMTLLWNQGFVACYNFSHYDKRYGSSRQKVYGAKDYTSEKLTCPECEGEISERLFPSDTFQNAETNEEILDRPLDEFTEEGKLGPVTSPQEGVGPDSQPTTCPNCGQEVSPITTQENFQAPYVKEEKDVEKCRQILEFYGPLNVQIPYYARLPKDIGWIILSHEAHYAQMRALYSGVICLDGKPLSEKIQPGPITNDTYERWARTTTYDYFSSQTQLVTVQRVWYKPWMFEALEDPDLIAELNEEYPKGVYVVFVNEVFAEAYPEDPDEHWTFTINPLEERINASPFGKFLIPVQEMINELVFLIMETIQYGVPVNFADDEKFNFQALNQTKLTPGNIYPITRSAGENINEYIASIKTATLSNEVPTFLESCQYFGQLVSGAFPQIFGGTSNNRTIGQDESARNAALQRLSTAWRMLNTFWATLMSKAVKNFERNLLEDETYIKDLGTSQISVEIKTENLTGEIGEVKPETNDQFPVSWSQQRDMIMQLIQLNNPQILTILGLPENVGLIKKVLGVDELYIPGNDDRNKQLSEIQELIKATPMPDLTGNMTASVPIEPEIDNHQIHIEVARAFLSSPVGQFLKKYNPNGYQNVMLHIQEHQMFLQSQMMPPQPPQPQGGPPQAQDQSQTQGEDNGLPAPTS